MCHKPIVESPYNKIIFKGLFFLIVWAMIFLVAPAPFFNLKRFKIFNLEIELERQQQSIATYLDISFAKNKFMYYLTSDEAYGKMLYFYNPETGKINFLETIKHFLKEMRENYITEFNLSFELQICPETQIDEPEVRDLVAESKEKKEAIISNKKGDHTQSNYLVFCFEETVCVLSSYRTEFEVTDKYIIEQVFARFAKGDPFKSASDFDLKYHSINDPRDLVANSPYIEEIMSSIIPESPK